MTSVQNADGDGKCLKNYYDDVQPYCYVKKEPCTAAGIEFYESEDPNIAKHGIGWSEALCSNQKNVFFFAQVSCRCLVGRSILAHLPHGEPILMLFCMSAAVVRIYLHDYLIYVHDIQYSKVTT